ncbi:MAG: hypothetical protein COW01_13915 [Bdellovibrionales bacterium CG12_big_fil_rev_8_21_14_0_65_38_15]|nr:MAG: hypothetical protein COW79_16735 [Bdellovibrionales bacterium CG22_combo_CG10-13_8_21_14_all_38_13]PIQ53368.1 MAG: hypothetical protein COW01_13915 [Bdellovibrionales bacterium CG12_big_fil_rev_8_21_14_0_65_38_15]PIR30269.1 MAG: hypothetical protein COV38_05840 [Bdellovibrionales bacterium CG11_big_fil_rev_8_21_14_0_20_38_13]
MEGISELFDNFNSNFDGLDESRRAQVLLYSQAIKLSKFNEFKLKDKKAFDMVKNLFILPGKFNKEQLELFSASFIQNTQSCMAELEKGGTVPQVRDMENKLFASLLWALTFGSCSDGTHKEDLERIWNDLLKCHKDLSKAFIDCTKGLNLDPEKLKIMEKASKQSIDEMQPVLS